jgi:hypothetical protein
MHPKHSQWLSLPIQIVAVSNRYPYCNLYRTNNKTACLYLYCESTNATTAYSQRICTVWFIQCFISCNVISYKWNKPHNFSINSSRVWHHPFPIYALQVLTGYSPVHSKERDFEGCCRSNPNRDVTTKRKAKGEGVLGKCSILISTYFFNLRKWYV